MVHSGSLYDHRRYVDPHPPRVLQASNHPLPNQFETNQVGDCLNTYEQRARKFELAPIK